MAIRTDFATDLFVRGETIVIQCTHVDDDGVAVDISSYTLRAEVRESPQSTVVAAGAYELGTGIEFTTDGSDGRYDITIPRDDTKGLTPRTRPPYYWEAWRTNADNEARIGWGDFPLGDEVSSGW